MSYITMADLAQVRRRKPRRYFVPSVTQRTDDSFVASEKGQAAFGGMAFEAKAVEDAPIVEESGPGSFEPSDIDPGLGQLPLTAAQAPASLGMLDTVATALAVGAGVVLVGSWLMSPKEKKANPSAGARRKLKVLRSMVVDGKGFGREDVVSAIDYVMGEELSPAARKKLKAFRSRVVDGEPCGREAVVSAIDSVMGAKSNPCSSKRRAAAN